MCYYPKLIRNKKYTSNKKNQGNIPVIKDERVLYVSVGCGRCEMCLKKKARGWTVRLLNEIKYNKTAKFITLTFSEKKLNELSNKYNVTESNALATLAMRHFLERWRKKYGKSVKHWFTTELGHQNTERIHLHGILWTDKTDKEIVERWQNGFIWVGDYVTEKTVNYIMKYVTKIDNDHKNFIPKILCSSGLGKNYINSLNMERNKYRGLETDESYVLTNGYKTNIPIYYRNKLYTESQREKLWIKKLDENILYLNGDKYNLNIEEEKLRYYQDLEFLQRENIRRGYGDDSDEWKRENYNATLTMLNKLKREAEHFRMSKS